MGEIQDLKENAQPSVAGIFWNTYLTLAYKALTDNLLPDKC